MPECGAPEGKNTVGAKASTWCKRYLLRIAQILLRYLFLEHDGTETITTIEAEASTWFNRGLFSLVVMQIYLLGASLVGIEKFSTKSFVLIGLCIVAASCSKQWRYIPFQILTLLLFMSLLFYENKSATWFVFGSLWLAAMFCLGQWNFKSIPLKQFNESTRNRLELLNIIHDHKSYAIYLRDFLTDGDLLLGASDIIPKILLAPIGASSLRTFNPLEAGVLRDITNVLPVFCLLNIHDVTTNSLAKRIHCSNSNWFDELKELGKDARVFLFSIEKMTERIWQEVEWVFKLQSGSQIVIVAPKEVLSTIERSYGPSDRMFLAERKPGGARAVAKRQHVALPDDLIRSVKASLSAWEETQKLVRMANRIGKFYASMPEQEATERAASHLRLYWTPKMIREIIAFANQGHPGLNSVAARAVRALKETATPA
jgi:formate dehydrogenase subunit delta